MKVGVFSYGGCGCSYFREAIGLKKHSHDKHYPYMPKKHNDIPYDKYVYIYGDPRNAVISFLDRAKTHFRFIELHTSNMLVNNKMPPNITIEQYAEAGEDQFKLMYHFNRWVSIKSDRLLIVRYNDMFDNCDEISKFLGYKIELKRRNRKSDWERLDETIKDKLTLIYKPMLDKINKIPPVYIAANVKV